jgi:hypothetical protein
MTDAERAFRITALGTVVRAEKEAAESFIRSKDRANEKSSREDKRGHRPKSPSSDAIVAAELGISETKVVERSSSDN